MDFFAKIKDGVRRIRPLICWIKLQTLIKELLPIQKRRFALRKREKTTILDDDGQKSCDDRPRRSTNLPRVAINHGRNNQTDDGTDHAPAKDFYEISIHLSITFLPNRIANMTQFVNTSTTPP